MLAGVEEILDFWFADAADSPQALKRRNQTWFSLDREFDHEVRSRFEVTLELASTGACGHWEKEPRSLLALILLFDQFPRNMHRGTAQAFSYDDSGLRLCRMGIDRQMDRPLGPVERVFFYMPLQHAEEPQAQALSVELSAALLEQAVEAFRPFLEKTHRYAIAHRDIIARFGRFPHRNAVLGRDSTDAEKAYLEDGATSFGQ